MSMCTVTIRTLTRARRLIAERGWTKRVMARAANGTPVRPRGRAAVSYCAAGAICRSAPSDGVQKDAMLAMLRELPPASPCLTHFNDSRRSVKPVLALFDRAIAALEKEAADAQK